MTSICGFDGAKMLQEFVDVEGMMPATVAVAIHVAGTEPIPLMTERTVDGRSPAALKPKPS